MPFLSYNTHKLCPAKGSKSYRKEHDAYKSPNRDADPVNSVEKASASFFCYQWKGSVTLETALILPFFFLAVICLVYRLEITAVQTNIRAGLRSAGKELAREAALVPVVSPGDTAGRVVDAIGAARLDRSLVKGGSAGIDCSKTWVNPMDGKLYLSAVYELMIPIPVFHIPGWEQEEKLTVKIWNGYEADSFGSLQQEEIVYITENGVVYHKSPNCHYLELAIRPVAADAVAGLRNADGSRYQP